VNEPYEEAISGYNDLFESLMRQNIGLFRCPDCCGKLTIVSEKGKSCALLCDDCDVVFPIKDEIIIILSKNIRSYDVEYPLLKELGAMAVFNDGGKREKALRNTVDLVVSLKNLKTWEWMDEEFWSEQYYRQIQDEEEVIYVDRVWQRSPMVKEMLSSFSLNNKMVLSVGCGNGYNFRQLLLPHCSESTLYLATDISFTGLLLNKKYNPHRNSMYVLCSADYPLPFIDESIDVATYFGILHHTKDKSRNLVKNRDLLSEEGFVLIHEVLDRPLLPFTQLFERETSEHEESIAYEELDESLKEFRVVFRRKGDTPFITLSLILFRGIMESSRYVYQVFSFIDNLVANTLGKIVPHFSEGSILILAKKSG